MPPPLGGARAQQYARQDRLFGALERLEAKDTQAGAYDELKRLIKQDLDAANLSTLLHAVGSKTAKTSQFSKVHSLRLVALCATPGACMQWQTMLQPPLLGKLLGLLSRALRDGDSAVRAAAGECFGVVAAQLATVQAPHGDLNNPLLACLLEALGEPGGKVQAAAATALAQVADHLQPLDPALLRQLLRALDNPLFLGRAELWQAVAWLEDGHVHGLAASSWQPLQGMMSEVLGNAADCTGLLGALNGRGKDFQLRAAAACTLKALAVGMGPYATGWDAAVSALKVAKTDVSKPVRDAALAALPVVVGVQEFVTGGLPPEQWPAVCSSLLAGARAKHGVPGGWLLCGGKLAGAEEAEAGEHISALHSPAGSGSGGYAMPVPAQLCPQLATPGSMPPAPAALGSYAAVPPAYLAAPVLAGVSMPAAVAPAFALPQLSVFAQPMGSQQLVAQLEVIQEQQASLAATLAASSTSTQHQLQQLQRHLASVSAAVAGLAVGAGAAARQAHSKAVAGVSAPPPANTLHQVSVSPKRLSSLHRSYQALEQLHAQQQHQRSAAPLSPPVASSPGISSLVSMETAPLPAQHPALSAQVSTVPAPCPWQQTYAQLLSGSSPAGDHQLQLRLLRCMAKSGPVWELLDAATGQRLLQAITALLQEGIALKRLLPWLWPLADTSSPACLATSSFPPALRQRLVTGLAAYKLPAPTRPDASKGEVAGPRSGSPNAQQLSEKRDLLLSSLRAVWS